MRENAKNIGLNATARPHEHHYQHIFMAADSGRRLGIGILAHNEAARLPSLIESLFEQSIFTSVHDAWATIKVACVPNGCTDATAAVARQSLSDAAARLGRADVAWMVDELVAAGKANAWNHCVHESLGDCDDLCFLDADIVFASNETIASTLAILVSQPHVCVVTDRPIKKGKGNDAGWAAKLSRYISSANPPGPTEICGQFYCARAAVLRSIWLPPGLPVEDGFLRAMVITNEFRAPEDPRRITRAERAAHFFEPKTRPRDVWRHRKRLMIGTTLNYWLFQHLWENAGGRGAGQLLREHLQRDPAWLSQYLSKQCEAKAWLVPLGHVFRRINDLRAKPLAQAARRAPAALAATAVDVLAAVSANREIKRNLGLGFW